MNRVVFGYDSEFSRDNVSVVQLSTSKLSCVIQVGVIGKIPQSLLEVVNSKKVLKVGVCKYYSRKLFIKNSAVHMDLQKLANTFKDQNVVPAGFIDVAVVAYKHNLTNGEKLLGNSFTTIAYKSLNSLSRDIVRQSKEEKQILGSWYARKLSEKQIK